MDRRDFIKNSMIAIAGILTIPTLKLISDAVVPELSPEIKVDGKYLFIHDNEHWIKVGEFVGKPPEWAVINADEITKWSNTHIEFVKESPWA